MRPHPQETKSFRSVCHGTMAELNFSLSEFLTVVRKLTGILLPNIEDVISGVLSSFIFPYFRYEVRRV